MKITTEITTEVTALFFQGLEEKLEMLRARQADLESRVKELTSEEYRTLLYTREQITYYERQQSTIADLLCFAELKEREAYYAGK